MLVKYVMDDHAPLKRKRTVKKPVPFMNSKLRKACHRKAMHRNRYFRHGRTKDLWNKYRKTRNEVTKLKTISMKNYFSERCNNENYVKNPTQYRKTIKPFLAKMKEPRNNVTLQQNGKIINDPSIVSNIFNNYFRTVAMEIGNESPFFCSIHLATIS